MKKIFLTTVGISLLTLPALAVKPQFFVGLNASSTNVSYNSETEQVMGEFLSYVPDFYSTLGAEAGVKFLGSKKDLVTFGGSVAYDYAFDKSAVVDFPYNQVYKDINMGFSALSFMADAYYNMDNSRSKKSAFILGLGYSNITQRLEAKATEYAIDNGVYSINEEQSAGAMAFKIGLSIDLKYGFSIQTTLRYLMPTKKDAYIDGAFLWGVGIRYTF